MQEVGQSLNHNAQGLCPKQPASCRSGFTSKTGVAVGGAFPCSRLQSAGQEQHPPLGSKTGRGWSQSQKGSCLYTKGRDKEPSEVWQPEPAEWSGVQGRAP